jgi:hypothetical protein
MYVSTIWQVTYSLAAKGFQSSLSLCRGTFFSSTMEDHVVKRSIFTESFFHKHFLLQYDSKMRIEGTKPLFFLKYFRYQELMKEGSRMPLFDLRKLNASLPVPSVPSLPLEVLVLGANNDFIVVSSMSNKPVFG